VATTRPETMLGDTAAAVHPDDDRYKDLIGKEVLLPIANRRIPIIADPILVDPEFGTGVVKVTPAHDKNDYEAGLRNNLPQIQVIDETGHMTDAAGADFNCIIVCCCCRDATAPCCCAGHRLTTTLPATTPCGRTGARSWPTSATHRAGPPVPPGCIRNWRSTGRRGPPRRYPRGPGSPTGWWCTAATRAAAR